MQDYMDSNTHNNDGYYTKLSETGSGYLYLDIATSNRISLYKLNKEDYSNTNEFIVEQ